jgi:hypothetical protein
LWHVVELTKREGEQHVQKNSNRPAFSRHFCCFTLTAGPLDTDIETCREGGGAVKVIACIEDPVVIEKMLTYLNGKAASAGTGLLPASRAPP